MFSAPFASFGVCDTPGSLGLSKKGLWAFRVIAPGDQSVCWQALAPERLQIIKLGQAHGQHGRRHASCRGMIPGLRIQA